MILGLPETSDGPPTVTHLQRPSTGRHLVMVCAIVALTTLPFGAKAVHIDDVYFLEVAGNVLKDPWRPFAGAVALEDIDYRVFAAAGRWPSTFASMSR